MTPVTIELPEDLAKEAEEAGLLAPEAMEALLRDRLRGNSMREVLRLADTVFVEKGPPMTLDEIQGEVNAVRAERRRLAAGS